MRIKLISTILFGLTLHVQGQADQGPFYLLIDKSDSLIKTEVIEGGVIYHLYDPEVTQYLEKLEKENKQAPMGLCDSYFFMTHNKDQKELSPKDFKSLRTVSRKELMDDDSKFDLYNFHFITKKADGTYSIAKAYFDPCE